MKNKYINKYIFGILDEFIYINILIMNIYIDIYSYNFKTSEF